MKGLCVEITQILFHSFLLEETAKRLSLTFYFTCTYTSTYKHGSGLRNTTKTVLTQTKSITPMGHWRFQTSNCMASSWQTTIATPAYKM